MPFVSPTPVYAHVLKSKYVGGLMLHKDGAQKLIGGVDLLVIRQMMDVGSFFKRRKAFFASDDSVTLFIILH